LPELPEVEYVARQLRQELVGHRLAQVRVWWDGAVLGMEPRAFEAHLRDRRVVAIGRRAKYLLVELDDGTTLVIHRRMSGNLVFATDGEDTPYTRVEFLLDDGRRLRFTDPRKFGRLALVPQGALPAHFARLGPEPLESEFTVEALAARLADRRRPLKALLLDQTVVAGLGNIYADEALFHARLHPLRTGASLSRAEVARLREGIQEVLLGAIEHGGTTFGRHRDVYNEAGLHLEHVAAYRRTGQPCPRCGQPITRITVAQRGTHFCPTCQQERTTASPSRPARVTARESRRRSV
jgi:formamidopyrimidine-DNA glycosylase